jgi:hypothetical protein
LSVLFVEVSSSGVFQKEFLASSVPIILQEPQGKSMFLNSETQKLTENRFQSLGLWWNPKKLGDEVLKIQSIGRPRFVF